MQKRFYWIAVIVGLLCAVFFAYFKSVSSDDMASFTGTNVKLQVNPEDATLTDIFTENGSIQSTSPVLTLSDVYREHYHAAELVQGNLYIIKRTNESDELWRYQSVSQGKKLFSETGLDFRVSPTAERIAVIYRMDESRAAVFLDTEGNILKHLSRVALGISDPALALEPLYWKEGSFWIATRLGSISADRISINPTTYSTQTEKISE